MTASTMQPAMEKCLLEPRPLSKLPTLPVPRVWHACIGYVCYANHWALVLLQHEGGRPVYQPFGV